MSRELSEDEKRLWGQVISGVNPLVGRPLSPVEPLRAPLVQPTTPLGYNPRLDLHGLRVQEAFEEVQQHIDQGRRLGYKKLTIISGRSGQINQEITHWLENSRYIRSIKPLRGGGAWEIWLKKLDM